MTTLHQPDATTLSYIVHPTDFTAESAAAFAHALRIALAAKGHLCVVHAEKLASGDNPDWVSFPGVRPLLAKWDLLPPDAPPSAVAERLGLRVSKADVTDTAPKRALARFFEEYRCDLLVLATHARQGLASLLHGSIAETLARQAQVPTLFLPLHGRNFVDPETGRARLANILLPVDLATPPHEAASLALRISDALECEEAAVHVLHTGSPDTVPTVTVDARHATRLRRIEAEGAIVPAILHAAVRVDADLLVMTTRGHDSLLDALRGSTTEQVLHHAGRAVLAVPAAA